MSFNFTKTLGNTPIIQQLALDLEMLPARDGNAMNFQDSDSYEESNEKNGFWFLGFFNECVFSEWENIIFHCPISDFLCCNKISKLGMAIPKISMKATVKKKLMLQKL